MGNSIQKKKKKKKKVLTKEDSPSVTQSPSQEKHASFRLLGRPDKTKAGRRMKERFV